MYLAYVDETGDSKCIMHSAVLVRHEQWNSALKGWLDWRKRVNRKYFVPASWEFHAVELLHGSFSPLPPVLVNGVIETPKINKSQGVQHEVFEKSLHVIGSLPITVISCWQRGTDRMASYQQLLTLIEDFLIMEKSFASLMVDGRDAGHRAVHRTMDINVRRIVEDPWMQASHESQLVQIADFVAYAAYQAATRQDGKSGLWGLYDAWLCNVIHYIPGGRSGIANLP